MVVGIAAREGLVYGIGLLKTLRRTAAETHLVLTDAAEDALGDRLAVAHALADHVYAPFNQAARISSGSFLTRGMVVAPCDGHALAAIALGLATNLVYRAADVTLKERRPLVLGLTYTPSAAIELETLERARRVPGLVATPLDGPADEEAVRLLAQLGLDAALADG